MACLQVLQVDDAVRAVAAKNNRPDSQLTGTRPLKMRYKPDKVRTLRHCQLARAAARCAVHPEVRAYRHEGTPLPASAVSDTSHCKHHHVNQCCLHLSATRRARGAAQSRGGNSRTPLHCPAVTWPAMGISAGTRLCVFG